jgi:cytochrome c oxidase subunit 1
VTIPRIRSESPAFDLHHPEIAAIELEQNEAAAEGRPADAPDMEGREDLVKERTDDDQVGEDR